MEENKEIKKGEKEQIINALVKMRIERFSSQKTMLDFLMNQLGYGRTYAYELLDLARKRIGEIFKEEHEEAYEAAVGRLQEIIETTTSEKVRLEATKELHKLQGLYRPQRIDITTNGKDITGIQIEIVTNESKDQGNTGTE
jgi:hypothetical protein